MCPACLAATAGSVVSLAAGASSVGGVVALVVARLGLKPGEASSTAVESQRGDDNGAAENRLAR